MSRFTHHTHRSRHGIATPLRISTHTAGQAFGTYARVTRQDGTTLHETATFGLGHETPAIQAARRWIDAQGTLPASEAPATA